MKQEAKERTRGKGQSPHRPAEDHLERRSREAKRNALQGEFSEELVQKEESGERTIKGVKEEMEELKGKCQRKNMKRRVEEGK